MDVSAVAPFSKVACPACGEHTRVKDEFGPYTLIRRHAIGGMSVVFMARDNTLNREVIVKILNEEYGSDEKRIGAFEEEARITASFSHPHVVRVFTTGRAFDQFYIAMELVPGGHFEHHIKERGSIPEKEMLPLAIQIAEGLKAAHTAGLIHRDMKPGNILLDAAGNAKIVDFGLALVTKGGKAQAAEIWATPYYVPPETIEGQEEDFRSDVYAFGATIYHALAGKPSCDEESMNTNRLREAKLKIPSLAKVAPWISADTCAVVDRAMAHSPADRFRSYDDLIGALEGARQRLGSGLDAPSDTTARNRQETSPVGEKIGLIAAGLALVGSVAFGAWWVTRPDDAVVVVDPPPKVEVESDQVKPTTESVGAIYAEAGDALRSRDYAKARELFVKVRDQPDVLEPTGSWAACEAVICSYLDGKTSNARQDARAADNHIQRAPELSSALRVSLLQSLEKLAGFPPAEANQTEETSTGVGLLSDLMLGIRNWEHGMPAAAIPFFTRVTTTEAAGTDAWIAPYQEIIEGYLSDADRLESIAEMPLPDSPKACRERVDDLHAVYTSLKTKGRARYNVRALQHDLEVRADLMEAEPEPAPVSGKVASLPELVATSSECRFSDAVEMLKNPEFTEAIGTEVAEAYLLLNEAASSFLSEMEEALKVPRNDFSVILRDQTAVTKITGSQPGGAVGLLANGGSRLIKWSEVSPDSLIELHRELVKDETSEIERLRRHEQAIAYDILAGDAERGKKAGAGLASRYPSFEARWELVLPALH